MSSVDWSPQVTGMRRSLLVIGLLLGVLFMHGLTADHDPSMPSASTMSSHQVAGGEIADDEYDAVVASDTGSLVASPSMHTMVAMCVAVLFGGLLLPRLRAFRLSGRNVNRHLPSAGELCMLPRAAATRWVLAPSLTGLCVSRT